MTTLANGWVRSAARGTMGLAAAGLAAAMSTVPAAAAVFFQTVAQGNEGGRAYTHQVTETDRYFVTLAGGVGGQGSTEGNRVFMPGGAGAQIRADFNLIAGQTLTFYVGRAGHFYAGVGSGGEGSFFVLGSPLQSGVELLLAAGGGGGSGAIHAGGAASLGQSGQRGQNGPGVIGGMPGNNGYGGNFGGANDGKPGGGFHSGTGSAASGYDAMASALRPGGNGVSQHVNGGAQAGCWGGGGGGGGGGYSGGAGGVGIACPPRTPGPGGGGGISFRSGIGAGSDVVSLSSTATGGGGGGGGGGSYVDQSALLWTGSVDNAGGGFFLLQRQVTTSGPPPVPPVPPVTPPAVPEPATWATMIAGFALVGTGLRRRRRRPLQA